jgi:putative ABC transport system substrate-binding protein
MANRRAFLAVALAVVGSAPPVARAQGGAGAVRVALLLPTDATTTERPFRDALHGLGYAEGRNLTIVRRSAGGDFARLPALAAELVGTRPDVLVAFLTQASVAAKQATTSIPVVIVAVGDPVGAGLVASLARPGGNVTGTASTAGIVAGKQLELIRELRPSTKRVAVLWNPGNAVFQAQAIDAARSAATQLGVVLQLVEARTPAEIEQRIGSLAGDRPDAALVLGEPLFIAHAKRLGELLAKHRLLAVGGSSAYAEHAMVATYAPDLPESARQAARVADRILRGARPADIPVEIVAKFELVLNLRTAKALGVAMPPALLGRADAVIR